MIQDIYPSKLYNAYTPHTMQPHDHLLYFDDAGQLLAKVQDGALQFLTGHNAAGETIYLFSCDAQRFFLTRQAPDAPEGFSFYPIRELRDQSAGKSLFCAFTAYHLWKWYHDNRFCGVCAGTLRLHPKERALSCPDCGNVLYPRINPAVIVGVIKGDALLITRYNRGYAHNALVAGFTEIGETLEETVQREVMEETGIRVKNIRYYKSQPWGMAQDILVGFYCEADGDAPIRMDSQELRFAEWVKREEIVLQPNHLSLTNEMMQMFRDGKITALPEGGDACTASSHLT